MRIWNLLILGVFVGCATTPDLRKSNSGAEDAQELFRRARFSELTQVDWNGALSWAASMRSGRAAEGEDLADFSARVAYRQGDGQKAKDALNGLPIEHSTRRLLEALLDNVDLRRDLRKSSTPQNMIELPLEAHALSLGYPIIQVHIEGRKFNMLWDTGASDNVLAPHVLDELGLPRTDVRFGVKRDDDGFVVRFATTGTRIVSFGSWSIENTPWIVTDLERVEHLFKDKKGSLDGFLSPQLLIPNGCFAIDKARASLRVGFDAKVCGGMLASAGKRTAMFLWNGEVFASAKIESSPELAFQVETGSPVTFLRKDAARYLPEGSIVRTLDEAKGSIAETLGRGVACQVAGRTKTVSTIDLDAERRTSGHDDLGSVGMDMLLDGDGVIVSFAGMEIGLLEDRQSVYASKKN